MKKLTLFLGKIDRIITTILKWLTIALFLALSLIVTVNILLRIFPITSLHWTDEIVELCIGAMVFYGAAGVWMVKGHFSVGDWISKFARSDRAKSFYRLVLELISLVFIGVLFKYSLDLTLKTQETTAVFQIPKKVLYSCMPISAFIMILYSLVYVVKGIIGMVNPKALEAMEPKAEGK